MSARLFALTLFFVLLAEAVVLVPSISKERVSWLNTRIEAAYLVSLALEAPEAEMIDPDTAEQLFETAEITGVTVNRGDARFLIYAPEFEDSSPPALKFVDLQTHSMLDMVAAAWSCMLSAGDNLISVRGTPMSARDESVEILVSERALRKNLLIYARNIFLISLFISGLTAAFIYQTLNRQIVKPVRRLTQNMAAFERDPEDANSLMTLSRREDEIGDAEAGLVALETRIQNLLAERKRLAALGSGISKISHDLRNILASAQLMSDRLAKSDDPRVRKLSPRLISSLDRAITLSNDTVSYGKMDRHALNKSPIDIHQLADEVLEDTATLHVTFTNSVPANISIVADRTQLYRAFLNIIRNGVEALAPPEPSADSDGQDRMINIGLSADTNAVHIDIADNGPGLPDEAIEHLFEPFKGTRKPGGSGLGIAIAYEIMRAHDGNLKLLKNNAQGATFRLTLPSAA